MRNRILFNIAIHLIILAWLQVKKHYHKFYLKRTKEVLETIHKGLKRLESKLASEIEKLNQEVKNEKS